MNETKDGALHPIAADWFAEGIREAWDEYQGEPDANDTPWKVFSVGFIAGAMAMAKTAEPLLE